MIASVLIAVLLAGQCPNNSCPRPTIAAVTIQEQDRAIQAFIASRPAVAPVGHQVAIRQPLARVRWNIRSRGGCR